MVGHSVPAFLDELVDEFLDEFRACRMAPRPQNPTWAKIVRLPVRRRIGLDEIWPTPCTVELVGLDF